MNPNLEHIKNICSKNMNKIPKGLNDYNINADTILSYINI